MKKSDIKDSLAYQKLLEYFPSGELDELGPVVEKMEQEEEDFTAEIVDMEYRFILTDSLDEIYFLEQKQFIEDEVKALKLPDYIKIDWNKTISYIQSCDGCGPFFAHYDGQEDEDEFGNVWYNFYRIN